MGFPLFRDLGFHLGKVELLAGLVDLGDGDVRELVVGRLFLVENAGQQIVRFRLAQRFGPFAQRTVSRNLVMLDGLATTNDRGVLGNRALGFFNDALGLLDQALIASHFSPTAFCQSI